MNNRPALWVPSLYFAEALPYMAVMTLSTIMYTNMGLTNTQLAFYTSWLYLPWVIKPLWSPLVDGLRTKRWWILAMQVLVGASLAGVGLTLPSPWWLQGTLIFFWLMAFSSATHDIAADGFYILGLDAKQQALYVGVRSTFYRVGSIFCQGLLVMLAGWLMHVDLARLPIPKSWHALLPMGLSGSSTAIAWSATMLLMALIMVGIGLWHGWSLPRVERANTRPLHIARIWEEFWLTLRAFFQKPHLVPALLFILLFRFPEAQLAKMAQPFMLRKLEEGGLGLSTDTVGFAYGTIGVIGLLAGGLLGGYVVSRHGLRRWLWPMVLSISLPDAVYVYFAYAQPQQWWLIDMGVALEQLGYGFGFTAYMLFLVYFSRGERSTSVFSICTALQAAGMMLPGMMAGWLADVWGFTTFFVWVCACCAVTLLVSALIKIEDK